MAHNEELHSLYHSVNIVRMIKSRRLRWGDYVTRKMLAGIAAGKRSLGRLRRRWEDNIIMDLK